MYICAHTCLCEFCAGGSKLPLKTGSRPFMLFMSGFKQFGTCRSGLGEVMGVAGFGRSFWSLNRSKAANKLRDDTPLSKEYHLDYDKKPHRIQALSWSLVWLYWLLPCFLAL